METIVYVLLMLLAVVELYLSIFVLNYAELIPFTVLALALAILMILIRIFYLERRIEGFGKQRPRLKKKGSILGLLFGLMIWVAVSGCAHTPQESRRIPSDGYNKKTATPVYWSSYDRPQGYWWWW
jgi:hypothetical protein